MERLVEEMSQYDYEGEIGHLTYVTLWRLRQVLPEKDVQKFLDWARENPETLTEHRWRGQIAWLEHDVRAWWATNIYSGVRVVDCYDGPLAEKRDPIPAKTPQCPIFNPEPIPPFEPMSAINKVLRDKRRFIPTWDRHRTRDTWIFGTSYSRIEVTAEFLRTVTPTNVRIVADHLYTRLREAQPSPLLEYADKFTPTTNEQEVASDTQFATTYSTYKAMRDFMISDGIGKVPIEVT